MCASVFDSWALSVAARGKGLTKLNGVFLFLLEDYLKHVIYSFLWGHVIGFIHSLTWITAAPKTFVIHHFVISVPVAVFLLFPLVFLCGIWCDGLYMSLPITESQSHWRVIVLHLFTQSGWSIISYWSLLYGCLKHLWWRFSGTKTSIEMNCLWF